MYNQNLQFNIIFRPEMEGGFTVIVPSLPGCITYGETLESARKMAIDAILGYITSLRKHKKPIPASDEQSFISTVRISANNKLNYA